MFPRRMSLQEVRMSGRLVSSSMLQCYPCRCRGACRMLSTRRDTSLNLLVLFFVCGAVSLSQVDVPIKVIDLGVVYIFVCVVFIITFVFDLLIFRP